MKWTTADQEQNKKQRALETEASEVLDNRNVIL